MEFALWGAALVFVLSGATLFILRRREDLSLMKFQPGSELDRDFRSRVPQIIEQMRTAGIAETAIMAIQEHFEARVATKRINTFTALMESMQAAAVSGKQMATARAIIEMEYQRTMADLARLQTDLKREDNLRKAQYEAAIEKSKADKLDAKVRQKVAKDILKGK